MARTIKSKFEYQVQELVANLTEANSTSSSPLIVTGKQIGRAHV